MASVAAALQVALAARTGSVRVAGQVEWPVGEGASGAGGRRVECQLGDPAVRQVGGGRGGAGQSAGMAARRMPPCPTIRARLPGGWRSAVPMAVVSRVVIWW